MFNSNASWISPFFLRFFPKEICTSPFLKIEFRKNLLFVDNLFLKSE